MSDSSASALLRFPPDDYDGPRDRFAIWWDLVELGFGAYEGAGVTVESADGSRRDFAGAVRVERDGRSRLRVRVDGELAFVFDLDGCRDGRLFATDGEHFSLRFRLGDATVEVSD